MYVHNIGFGVDTKTGKPFVRNCRGVVRFENALDAAAFVAARTRALLEQDTEFWQSFELALSECGGVLTKDEDLAF